MRIYGTIKDALLAPESLIDGRGGLEKATKGSRGGAQPTRSVFGLQRQQRMRLTRRIRRKKKKIPRLMR